MKRIFLVFFLGTLILTGWIGCEKDSNFFDMEFNSVSQSDYGKMSRAAKAMKVTGSVEIVWKGNSDKSAEKRAFAEFNAFDDEILDKGTFKFIVRDLNMRLHREISVEVTDVLVDPLDAKAWFVGEVVSDTKACNDHGGGGHGSGGSHGGGGSHEDGGCDHDDGGCSHDDGDVSHHDEHDDGCSGGGDDHGGGSTGSVSGKNCRIGQILMAKVHDKATPGAKGDGLTWKWFDPGMLTICGTGAVSEWPHLCRKEILEGNLVVHK